MGTLPAAVLLLVSSGLLRCSSSSCPGPCACPGAPVLNCSSRGLSSAPRLVRDAVAELDLSHNLLGRVAFDRPRPNLRAVRLGDNGLERLSLCVDRAPGPRSRLRGPGARGEPGCESWAPGLQLLSVERNRLQQLPLGLEGSASLQILQLSFNRISALRPADLQHLRQLKELHLHHNLISSLHPQMFQDLAQLRVLDLSFNVLTSLHPLTYLSLRNIGADVRLGGNRWRCDCSMRSLRRRMADGGSRGLQAWSLVCASPSSLSGRDLLQLQEDELNCLGTENGPELHRDVTVYRGAEILLSCAPQGSVRWTPSGEASGSQPPEGLVISDINERDTGLYVCVSEKHKVVSVFNLQISKVGGARRKSRSLPRTGRQIIPQGTPNRTGQERNQRAAQCNLALAVCLSVFTTFLIAFILGVLARPYIDALWRRVTKKKSPSATDSVSSAEQRQYDNEAFSNGEEPEYTGPRRERRVTFSTVDFREDNNVKYYDTVIIENLEGINNDAVIECEAAERDANRAGDSARENSLRQSGPVDSQRDPSGFTDEGRTQEIDFEHIPDPVEQRRRSSSCSGSSLSDNELNENKVTQGNHSTLESRHLTEDSVQQRADCSTPTKVEVPQLSIEGQSELSGFSREPFADWSPHTNNTNQTDPDLWQENEEQFEFSDSVRSTSARSSGVCSSFNDSKRIVLPTFGKQKTDDSSSSSSYVSEGEQTRYTVNSDQGEEVLERNRKQDANFEQQVHDEDAIRPSVQFNQGDYRYETQRPAVRPHDSSSSLSSDSDGGGYTVKKGSVPSLAVTSHGKSMNTGAPSSPAIYSSSSSSESEAEHDSCRLNEGIKMNEPETLSTNLDRQYIHQTKRPVDIMTPLPASDSSTSDDGMDETTKPKKNQGQGEVDMVGLPIKTVSNDTMKPHFSALDIVHAKPIKRSAPLPPTDSNSSVERAAKTTNHMQKQGETHMTRLPIGVSPTGGHDPDTRWPTLDLQQAMRIKKRLDIKGPSPPPDSSSSSDSEDETTDQIKKQKQEEVSMARLPSKVSPTVSSDPQTQWPRLDLERTTRIKRRLDIKGPSPDSSSSSDSEDETTRHTERPRNVDIAASTFQESQTGSHDPDSRWPALDLKQAMRINRRLDIKGPSPDPSSSSDSEDETTHQTEKPVKVDIAGPPVQVSQTGSHDPDTRWPAIDLQQAMRIKKRLDIKGPSTPRDSSSSSDNEDETTDQIKKQKQEEVSITRLPSKVSPTVSSDPQTQWPLLDLERTTHIKRRLDIKGPSPDSSSSSDSEDETTHHTEKPVKVDIARPPVRVSQKGSHDPDTRWPTLDLQQAMRIKKRLDIKAPSPPDSSSGCDSEDETTDQIKKQKQEEVSMARLPSKVSPTVSFDPQTQWPLLDLERTTRIKRRLDIKGPLPDSSSSSESEDETTHHTERPRNVDIVASKFEESQTGSHDPDTRWPALDLKQAMRIKRRLDIKGPSLDSSSSSDSEDETTHHTEKPVKVDIAGPPVQVSQTGSHDPDTRWPTLDLKQAMRIKRRLDIKGPSPDSSSSSDSEDESTRHTERPRNVDIAASKLEESQTGSHDPDTRWPALDLKQAMRIKRRLDIKGPSPPPDTSSSSDSEDETTDQIKKQKQEEVSITRLPSKASPTASSDPQTQWPLLDLERTTHIKRRLDIKGPSPDSSSSSDSEDETTHHTEKPVKVDIARPPVRVSQTGSHDPDTRWPALDLQQAMRIKKRLDIKAPSPPDSSCSSDSEDKTTDQIKKQKQEVVSITRLPSKVSPTVSSDPQTQWPRLDLERTTRIKRRLDIKGPLPDSSSSSDSEDETTHHTERPRNVDIAASKLEESQTGGHDPDTRWPALDLKQAMRIKRRLDIKGPSPPPDTSSSSDSEDETTEQIKKQKQEEVSIARLPSKVSPTVSYDLQTQWPVLERTTRIKRRLDIKGPSPDSSSGSDSEDETLNANAELGLGVSAVPKTTENEFIRLPKIPVINTSTSPKTDHNIKLEKYTVITDEVEDNISTTPEINPELQSRWATMNLGVSRFRKRLEITSQTHKPPNLPSSSPPDSPKSSRTKEKKRRVGMQGQLKTESLLTSENKPVNVSLSLGGQGDISGESVEVTERLRKDYSQHTTEGNPDSTLTVPHFRRYLDIKVNKKATPTPPLRQLPDSFSSSSENEDALIKSTSEGWRKEASQNRSSLYVAQTVNIKPDQPQNQSVQRKAGLELESQTDSVQHNMSLTNIPRIRRALDVRAQRESSPTSSSEAETEGLSVPDLSLGVPRVTRRLNVKALLPRNTPSSYSESENDVTLSTWNRSRPASNMSGLTADDSLITYKRVIMKTSSLPSNVFSPSGEGQTTDYRQRYMGTESVAQEGPSFLLKKRTEQTRRITDVDVPPEKRWTGVGRQLSDLSIPSLRRHLDVGVSSPPAESELPPPGSSNSSTSESNHTNQDKGRAEVPLMPNHLSLGARSVSPSSSRALDTLKAASEARNERRGLGALKAMSSERRKWDTIDENVAMSASPRDDGLQGDTGFDYRKSGEEFKESTSRVTDLVYDIPRYRRHDIGGTEPPQGAPPPIPITPPPPSYEGLTWRSPQSGNTEESVAFYSHFANEKISEA